MNIDLPSLAKIFAFLRPPMRALLVCMAAVALPLPAFAGDRAPYCVIWYGAGPGHPSGKEDILVNPVSATGDDFKIFR